MLEPVDRLELTTCCLQNHCPTRTTDVRHRQNLVLYPVPVPNSDLGLGQTRPGKEVQTIRDTVRAVRNAVRKIRQAALSTGSLRPAAAGVIVWQRVTRKASKWIDKGLDYSPI